MTQTTKVSLVSKDHHLLIVYTVPDNVSILSEFGTVRNGEMKNCYWLYVDPRYPDLQKVADYLNSL